VRRPRGGLSTQAQALVQLVEPLARVGRFGTATTAQRLVSLEYVDTACNTARRALEREDEHFGHGDKERYGARHPRDQQHLVHTLQQVNLSPHAADARGCPPRAAERHSSCQPHTVVAAQTLDRVAKLGKSFDLCCALWP